MAATITSVFPWLPGVHPVSSALRANKSGQRLCLPRIGSRVRAWAGPWPEGRRQARQPQHKDPKPIERLHTFPLLFEVLLVAVPCLIPSGARDLQNSPSSDRAVFVLFTASIILVSPLSRSARAFSRAVSQRRRQTPPSVSPNSPALRQVLAKWQQGA